ncbi:MAG: 1-deoxy-D-xylulose-5-phosphate reductoisomerase [Bacteroidales bacterium]|nr:1-deoxy-D-xylulose-5-phosphate reductoisomerase [Bacteroidales bacterium]
MNKKKIAILGSTGSIGTQALDVIEQNPDLFEVEVLTANSQFELLIQQAIKFKPNAVVIVNDDHYDHVYEALDPLGIKVYAGRKALDQIVQMGSIDMVLTALVGFAGLSPTLEALKAGKAIALANKETLVVAGELVMATAKKYNAPIIPVDSEHSAIFQCLVGEEHNPVEKIILTASGGPFRTKSLEEIEKASLNEALNHPNWSMGSKVTIDSATLMNKGLEAIEAKWLFGLKPEQVEIIVHPQSIIHSLVGFADGSLKAQLGLPDMRLPIQYALGFPYRIPSNSKRFSFTDFPNLNFEQPDLDRFPNLRIALECMQKAGNMPCVMNAANEVAVDAFLNEKISFTDISRIIEKTIVNSSFLSTPDYQDYIESDQEARNRASSFIY